MSIPKAKPLITYVPCDKNETRWSDVFFQRSHEQLQRLSEKMMQQFPGTVPIILDRSADCLIKPTKNRLRGNKTDPIGVIFSKLREGWTATNASKGLFYFIWPPNGIPQQVSPGQVIGQLYKEYNRDGFMYITVSEESTFG